MSHGRLSPREFSTRRYQSLEYLTKNMKFEQRQRRVGKGKWDRASAKKNKNKSKYNRLRMKKDESPKHALPGMNLQFGDMRFRAATAMIVPKKSKIEPPESKNGELSVFEFNAQRVKDKQLSDKRQSLRKKLGRLRLKESEIRHDVSEKNNHYHFLAKELKKLQTEERAMLSYKDDVMDKCRHAVAIQQDRLGKLAECEEYAITLRLMERRLWDQQITFKRTMASYMQALKLQKYECADLEQEAKFIMSRWKHLDYSFVGMNQRHDDELKKYRESLITLRQNITERDALMSEYKGHLHEEEARHKADNDKSIKKIVTDQINEARTVKRMTEFNKNVRTAQQAFRKIMLVTGLTDVKEILDKYRNRDNDSKILDDRVDQLKKSLGARAGRIQVLEKELHKAKIEANSGNKNKQEFIEQLSHSLEQRTRSLHSMRKFASRTHVERHNIKQSLTNLTRRLQNVRVTIESKSSKSNKTPQKPPARPSTSRPRAKTSPKIAPTRPKTSLARRPKSGTARFELELGRLPGVGRETKQDGGSTARSPKFSSSTPRSPAHSAHSRAGSARSRGADSRGEQEQETEKVTHELPKDIADKMNMLELRLRTMLIFLKSEPIIKLAEQMTRNNANFAPEVVSLKPTLKQRPASAKAAPRAIVGDNSAYMRAITQHIPNLPRNNTRVQADLKECPVSWERHRNLTLDGDESITLLSSQKPDILDHSKLMENTTIKRKALREHKTVEEVIESSKFLLKQQTILMDREELKREAKEIHRKATAPKKKKKSPRKSPKSKAKFETTIPMPKHLQFMQSNLRVKIKPKAASKASPVKRQRRTLRRSKTQRGKSQGNRTRISRVAKGNW